MRDGGLLLDLSRLNDVTIDKDALRATSGPGRLHHELAATLSRRGLFFPIEPLNLCSDAIYLLPFSMSTFCATVTT